MTQVSDEHKTPEGSAECGCHSAVDEYWKAVLDLTERATINSNERDKMTASRDEVPHHDANLLLLMKSDAVKLRERIRRSLPSAESKQGFVAQSLHEQMIETHRVLRGLTGAIDDFLQEHY